MTELPPSKFNIGDKVYTVSIHGRVLHDFINGKIYFENQDKWSYWIGNGALMEDEEHVFRTKKEVVDFLKDIIKNIK